MGSNQSLAAVDTNGGRGPFAAQSTSTTCIYLLLRRTRLWAQGRNLQASEFRSRPCANVYSGRTSPEPPKSDGKSLNLGRPSLMRSTVSA
jgi:hypothetical protein